jgi:hypothetical protein
VNAAEVYDLTTKGGATEFGRLIQSCESFGMYCLIGGMAVNCYVEPVYTLDVDLVVVESAEEHLREPTPASDLHVHFTTDSKYQGFLPRAVTHQVLGVAAKVACLKDVTRGKLWAYCDPRRRLSKRKKDELDLIRLGEKYPELMAMYPAPLRELMDRG